jgi:hypothetical protein
MTETSAEINKAKRRRSAGAGLLSGAFPLICGAIAGPLFTTVYLVAGATRADYSALKHDVSSLELGEYGWVQSLNFVLAGLLTLLFAASVRRAYAPGDGWATHGSAKPGRGTKWGPRLIWLWGLGLIGSGVFITDPIGGYPPGTAVEGQEPTGHGVLHNISAGLSFPSLLIAIILFTRMYGARRQRTWAVFSVFCGVACLTAIIVASYGAGRTGGVGEVDGLFQRFAGISGMAWLTVLALYLLVKRRPLN